MSTKNEEYENPLPLISYRLLKSNDEAELARLKHALVDSEYGFFQLEIDDDFAGEDKFGKIIKRVYDSGRKFFKELRDPIALRQDMWRDFLITMRLVLSIHWSVS